MPGNREIVIGVDSGTSACKVVAFTLDGDLVAETMAEHPIDCPRPGWAEQDPEWWWAAAAKCLRRLMERVEGCEVVGVGVDSQREAVVPISRDGERLSRSLIWLDQRALEVVPEMEEKLDEVEVIRRTGVQLDQMFSAAKLVWMRRNMPKVFEEAELFLFPKDYISFKLTGSPATDYSMASRTMLFNIHELRWDEELCEALDIPLEKLPKPHPSHHVIGRVSEEASAETGLPEGTPVVAGGGDRPCEALGGGAVEAGDVVLGTGTGSVIEVALDRPKPDEKGRAECCCHVIPGRWEYEITMMTTGASLKWFRDVFGREEERAAERERRSVYRLFDELAEKAPLGSENLFFYPYFMGARAPVYNPEARAVFHGIRLGHEKKHFIRSIMEGVVFQYAGALGVAAELGVEVKRITVVGGESKSDFWNQLKADVFGLPVSVVKIRDAAALGSAILAAVGSGSYSSVAEAADNMVHVEKVYEPRPDIHEAYKKVMEVYWEVWRRIEGSFKVY